MTNSNQTSQQPTPDNQEEKKIIRGKLPFVCYGRLSFVEIVTDDEDVAIAIGGMFADTFIMTFFRNRGLIDDKFAQSATQALGREFTALDEGYVSRLAHNAKIGKLADPFGQMIQDVSDGSVPDFNLLSHLR